METLVDLNRYLHDFSSAMWVCGTILIWMLSCDRARPDAPRGTRRSLLEVAGRYRFLTIPSLIISLVSGGIRAAAYAKYEHVGEVTSATIATMILKHVVFAAFVMWGIWVHWKLLRGSRSRTPNLRSGRA